MSDNIFALSCKHVDYRNFNHSIATRLLAHRSACHVYKDLAGQRRVVDAPDFVNAPPKLKMVF